MPASISSRLRSASQPCESNVVVQSAALWDTKPWVVATRNMVKLGGQTGNNNSKQTPKTVSSAKHEVHDSRGLGIHCELIVNPLGPLNTDQTTHLLRARLNKMLKICFWRKPLKDCCQMSSNYPIRPLDMLLIIFCASPCT